MTWSLPKYYNRRISRAIAEFDLIEDGDKIIVGFSGGKDSAFLVYSLAVLQKHLAIDFDLKVLTVDLGFDEQVNYEELREFCEQLEVDYDLKRTKIAQTVLEANQPCAKCSYFRKGVMTDYCTEHGFDKIAFGHHYDDAVETFLMSLLYSGQIETFAPKSYLSDSDIHLIRPLVYLREEKIIATQDILPYKLLESPCPYDGETKREEIKKLIKSFADEKQIFYNLASAMRAGTEIELWPEDLKKEQIKDKVNNLWNQS
ncbi:MAG: tRNA 2-thiocytidine biosynthesis TtcA family protein [Bacillota bacterium]